MSDKTIRADNLINETGSILNNVTTFISIAMIVLLFLYSLQLLTKRNVHTATTLGKSLNDNLCISKRGDMLCSNIKVAYQINDKIFASNFQTNKPYKQGEDVPVYYNPLNPTESVLTVYNHRLQGFLLLLLSIVLLGFVYIRYNLIRHSTYGKSYLFFNTFI